MAKILICDLCDVHEGDGVQVGQVADFDLCAKCAFTVLDRFAQDPEIRRSFGEIIGHNGAKREASAASGLSVQSSAPVVPVMTPEAAAKQRRAILFGQYGQDIFAVMPEVAVTAKNQIRYGQPGREVLVEVIEPVPGQSGKWFARIVDK